MLITGPELPYKLSWISIAMFTSSNGGGVIIAGGLNYDGDQSDVIELRAGEKKLDLFGTRVKPKQI